jgi:hypothetical protein
MCLKIVLYIYSYQEIYIIIYIYVLFKRKGRVKLKLKKKTITTLYRILWLLKVKLTPVEILNLNTHILYIYNYYLNFLNN